MQTCLDKAQVGDEVWVQRRKPESLDIREPFPTTVVGRYSPGNYLVVASNTPHSLTGKLQNMPAKLFIDSLAKEFAHFAVLSADRFKIFKIKKK